MPYTYLIGWSYLNRWYYGVRYHPKCSPKDLWKEYFTSSEYVQMMRDVFGEPDIIEIRQTFKCPREAARWETRVISRMKMFYKPEWLNRSHPVRAGVSVETIKKCRKNGETYQSIASRFGVSRQAIHQRLRKG